MINKQNDRDNDGYDNFLVSVMLVMIITKVTRCTRGVRKAYAYFLSRARMRSSNSVRMNKSNFTTEEIV